MKLRRIANRVSNHKLTFDEFKKALESNEVQSAKLNSLSTVVRHPHDQKALCLELRKPFYFHHEVLNTNTPVNIFLFIHPNPKIAGKFLPGTNEVDDGFEVHVYQPYYYLEIEELDDVELVQIILHELTHMFTDPFSKKEPKTHEDPLQYINDRNEQAAFLNEIKHEFEEYYLKKRTKPGVNPTNLIKEYLDHGPLPSEIKRRGVNENQPFWKRIYKNLYTQALEWDKEYSGARKTASKPAPIDKGAVRVYVLQCVIPVMRELKSIHDGLNNTSG